MPDNENKALFGKKRTRKKLLYTILMVVFAGVFVVSGINLIMIQNEYSAGESEYAELSDSFKHTATPAPSVAPDASPQRDSIDFDALQAINSEIVAWIELPDSVINYPVTRAADNDYYTHYTFEKKRNNAGAIFMNFQNSDDFSDANTTLFGHNMKNGSMFAGLLKLQEQEYFDAHSIVILYLPDGSVLEAPIFSVFIENKFYPYTQTSFFSDKEFNDFCETIKSKSLVTTDVTPTVGDRLLTLSTCAHQGDSDNRTVVMAILPAVD